jgi:hypothetical protein
MTQVAEPVAVWDANDSDYHRKFYPAVRDFLTAQGIPVNQTYRVEIFVFDTPFARVYSYALNEKGHTYYDHATDRPAIREPYDHVLTELPSEELRNA